MSHTRNSTALLSMAFSSSDGERPMTIHRQDPPWKVVRRFENGDGDCLVHMHNLSGGILGGDQLDLHVVVGEGSRVLLTSTGATRIYKHRAGRPSARCRMHALIARHALLEYLPDQLIPFRDSRFEQHTEIELDSEDAGVFWWETITPGRAASGEKFSYSTLQVRSVVSCAERPMAIDQFTLEPASRSLQRPGILGEFSCCSTFYICKTGVSKEQWEALVDLLQDEAEVQSSACTHWGVSTLVENGVVIRGIGNEASHLQERLRSFWKIAKRSLYGREAVLPRKVY